jgi:hypothetical protein
VPNGKLNPPLVGAHMFVKVLEVFKPSVSKSDLTAYDDYTKEFGMAARPE